VSEVSDVPAVKFCGAPTLDGGVCRQIVGVTESGRCVHHDPTRAEEAADMRRRGGQAAHTREPKPDDVPPPPEPKTLAEVIQWHSWTATALARGQIDKGVAGGLTYCLQQLRGALVSRDLEREISDLRAAVATLTPGRTA
jgi:hypothetical protein